MRTPTSWLVALVLTVPTVSLAALPDAEARPPDPAELGVLDPEAAQALGAFAALGERRPGGTEGTPLVQLDWPFLVDEDGDSMTGDLAFAGSFGVQFPGGRLSANPSLTFGAGAVCLANVLIPGCSGGDISAVNAGSCLTGGGASGDVTLAVDPTCAQLRVAGTCAVGQSIRIVSQDGTVACEADDDTTYAAGTGLNLAGTTFSVNTAAVQSRVAGACPVGSSVRVINSDGSVTCEADDDTTYSAGTGLTLTGTQFSVNPASVQSRVTGTCPAGQYVRVVAQDGSVTCGTDADTNSGGTVTSVAAGAGLAGGPITGSGTLSIATGGVTSGMVADRSLVAADVDAASLQLRVGQNCLVGNAIRLIQEDGTVACEPVGTGDITGILAGAGLTGGGFVDDVALAIAAGGVTSLMIANGEVGANDINDAEVQVRVAGACGAGESIRAIDSDGTVACETDDTGAVTAGQGIAVAGSVVSLFDCGSGEVPKGDAAGDWACSPDGVDGGDAATLGGLQASQFLRRDAADTYAGGVLTIDGASRLDVLGDLRVGTDSATDDDLISFDDGVTPESIGWADANSRFEISDEAAFKGAILVGGTTGGTYAYNRFGCCSGDPLADIAGNSDLFVVSDAEVGGKLFADKDVHVNADGPDGNAFLYFWNGNTNIGESIAWNEADDRFEVSDAALFRDALRVVGPTAVATAPRAYNVFGGGVGEPVSGGLANALDVYVQGSQEIGGSLFANGTVYLKGLAATGGDGDQRIYFYNNNVRTAESLAWDDTSDRFEVTDGLFLSGGALHVGLAGADPVAYNALASNTNVPVSGQMNTAGDLYVQFDQEVGDEMLLNDTLYMIGTTAAGADRNQVIYFYNGGIRTGESLLFDDTDDRLEWTDDVLTTGSLQIGTAAQQAYNRIGTAALTPEATVGNLADLMISDSLQIGGSAYKPGGGSWTATSDARLKRDVRPFDDGLAMLRGVDPVWYTYNGLGGTPEGLTAVGVLAQDLEPVAPYMVGTFQGKLWPGDPAPTALYHVDPSAFTFASINAIQELDAQGQDHGGRIAALEQQLAQEHAENLQLEARLAALEALLAQLVAAP